ncbi:type II toxin-antitoxin system RelE/ParE family toxin [Maricaulis sp. W15]|uniref:type II toxin-antitoxin system RelE/ParE family toxin n=1 Tax=Maricaulis sp. W15 TaxID=1772333 RepID=UPI000948DECA
MNVVFSDKSLADIETDQAGSTCLPVSVIQSARKKLTILRAAPNEQSLESWKSLNYERPDEKPDGRRFVRLSDRFRMPFTLDERTKPLTVTILSIEDYY